MEPSGGDFQRPQKSMICRIQKIELLEYHHMFLAIGCDEQETTFWFLKIFKKSSDDLSRLNVTFTEAPITKQAKIETLESLKSIFMRKIINCYGLAGFVRFLGPFYLVAVTKRKRVANIGPCAIYKIEGTELIPLGVVKEEFEDAEDRYKKLFMNVDLSTNFYFSYSYDLTNTLQYNMTPAFFDQQRFFPRQDEVIAFRQKPRDKFVWNSFLAKPLKDAGSPHCVLEDWVITIMHGFVSQTKFDINNRQLLLTVLARRSKEYAGTRFLKRGLNHEGNVANEVEMEQILSDVFPSDFSAGNFTSFVQIRGSVPLMWSQDVTRAPFKPKPDIVFDGYDPLYQASCKHFFNLFKHYGAPLIVFNLVKKRKTQETRLTKEYRRAITYVNQFLAPKHKVRYYHLDVSALTKQKGIEALGKLSQYSMPMVDSTGIFVLSGSRSKETGRTFIRQTGIVRVNCVDCLDRTNTAQFCLGLAALGKQFSALKVVEYDRIEYEYNNCASLLEEVYDACGDTIALQYGGSQLVHRVQSYRKERRLHVHTQDIFQSISRYYRNAFSDKEKQEAINVFLGVYEPSMNAIPLWELETDFFLHIDPRTSIENVLVPTRSWRDDLVLKSLPFATVERQKSEKSCSRVGILKRDDPRIDWYHDFYQPFRLTVLEMTLGSNLVSSIDKFYFSSRDKSKRGVEAAREFKVGTHLNVNAKDADEDGLDESEDDVDDDELCTREPKSPEPTRSERSTEVAKPSENTYISFVDITPKDIYGFEFKDPPEPSKELYATYVKKGTDAGMYTPKKQKLFSENFRREAQSHPLPFPKPISDFSGDSSRSVTLKEPSAADRAIYTNYLRLGREGATSVPEASQMQYQTYVSRLREYPGFLPNDSVTFIR